MKTIILITGLLSSLTAFAGLPLIQYSWHNQVKSSQLMIFDDGTILHQERHQYRSQTIQEENLSKDDVRKLNSILKNILKAKSNTEVIEASMGSYSGTIELRTDAGMKIVEGVVRDSVDLYHAKVYRSESVDMEELKNFIFKYTETDMDF